MPLLQTRDCPQELYDKLRAYAQEQRRTIAQQNIVILEEFFQRDGLASASRAQRSTQWDERIRRKRDAFDRIDKMGPAGISSGFPDAASLVREDRHSR